MPFGLINSGATFNRMMRKILADAIGADSFVDDILGHTKTWADHVAMMRCVFQRMREEKLTFRPSKCAIGCQSISFLGHDIHQSELHPQEDKVAMIMELPIPKTKRKLRSFLGLVGYYRQYIPNFSTIAVPLTDLTRKGTPNAVKWEAPQDEAFQKLKKAITSKPILRMPNFNKTFIVQTDASENGIGAALLQEHEEGRFPVEYASKKLLPREMQYVLPVSLFEHMGRTG